MAKKSKNTATQVGYISKASLKNTRVPPRKARLVVDLIRGHSVEQALELLYTSDKKTAPVLRKLLLSAVANAKKQSEVDVDELFVRRAWVNEGRVLGRLMPRAHGRGAPIRKRYSHIHVELDEKGAR